MWKRGYVHLYTGNGKGKPTAAFGLALRLAGSGGCTAIIQFMKGRFYSELSACERLEGAISVEQFGSKELCIPEKDDLQIHRGFAEQGLARAREVMANPHYSMVVLDEIVTALFFTIIRIEEILGLLEARDRSQELVLTGRYAPRQLIDCCDLVTEMKEIRHYYLQGVEARRGIEC